MAAPSLLGWSRAATRKVLQLEVRGLGEAAPSAALCTRPVGSGTPPRNGVAPQGSTQLPASQAAWPRRLSSSSLLASANKGESCSSANLQEASTPAAEELRRVMGRKTGVAFPQRGAVPSPEGENLLAPAAEGGWRKEVVEEESSSSSSSDSASSSDSEEEDEEGDSEAAVESKAELPRQDSTFSEDIAVKASMLAKENLPKKPPKEYVAKKKPCKTETDVSAVKQATSFKRSISQETSTPKARDPKVKSTPKEAAGQKLVLEAPVVARQELSDVPSRSPGTQGAALQLKASAGAQEDKKQTLAFQGEEQKVKETQEAEAAAAPKPEETSESTVVVVGTKEETTQEAGVQAGEGSTTEEPTAPAKPAPEELDNSTYKNLQHHDYNIYTFVDSVVGLSKFRQPQPSSGRASPRH